MKKIILFILFLLYFILTVYAQSGNVRVGFESNAQYYMDDEVTGDFDQDDPFRSNNYLKAEYTWKKLTAGIQLEAYAPQSLLSYSPRYDSPLNLATYHLSYNSDKIDIDAGYFYEQFGSGLVLRAWEDRQLGINNALRGLRVHYKPFDKLSFTALWGQQRVGFDVSEGQIFGFDTNMDLSTGNTSWQLGLSYAGRMEEIPQEAEGYGLSPITHNAGVRLQFAKGSVYTNIEGVVKTLDALVEDGTLFPDKQFYGNALTLELGYSRKGFGVNTTLRRMENMNFYTDRLAAGNTYNELIVNYLPALTKIHDYLLANIYVYQAQPALSFFPLKKAGEIGGQVDVYYKFKRGSSLGGKYGTKIAANFSNWYGLGADYNTEFRRAHVNPLDFGEEYFRDVNLEVRKKLNKSTHISISYINAFYNKTYIEEREGEIYIQLLVGDVTYKFGGKQSVRMDAQHLWTQQDKKNWAAATLEYNANSH
jgi:hypothetical protein